MSAPHSATLFSPDGEWVDPAKIAGIRRILAGLGAVGLVLSAVLFLLSATSAKFAYSWLYAFFFFFSLSLGGLFWVLLHNASNSGWGIVVRRVWENLACLIPFLFVLVLPLLVPSVRDNLWEWAREQTEVARLFPDTVEKGGVSAAIREAAAQDPHKHLLLHKYAFLNKTFFVIRLILYFAFFGGAALWLRRQSLRQDGDGALRWTFRARRGSCGLLPFFAVAATFAAVDLAKTLNYTWFSTMWGVYIFAGSALGAMAVTILLVSFLRKLGNLSFIGSEHYHMMGKLTFTFTVFWGYIAFCQYFLIWYANMTEETQYFLIRNTEGWNDYSTFLWIARFVIPFLLLLPAWVKRTPKYLTAAALWVLFAHALNVYHIIMPERGVSLLPAGAAATAPFPFEIWALLLDLVAFVTVGACSAFVLLTAFVRHRIYPARDPRLLESVALTN
ncbi:MAG TPA: hypothetical protein VMN36_04465 [Verrucomicrobiales bacterium]|nr:hypothetical protein [Verrucomicrobiales bacterium]